MRSGGRGARPLARPPARPPARAALVRSSLVQAGACRAARVTQRAAARWAAAGFCLAAGRGARRWHASVSCDSHPPRRRVASLPLPSPPPRRPHSLLTQERPTSEPGGRGSGGGGRGRGGRGVTGVAVAARPWRPAPAGLRRGAPAAAPASAACWHARGNGRGGGAVPLWLWGGRRRLAACRRRVVRSRPPRWSARRAGAGAGGRPRGAWLHGGGTRGRAGDSQRDGRECPPATHTVF